MEEISNTSEVPITLCSIFSLHPQYKWWAFRQMGLAQQYFKNTNGLRFGVMLGSGKGRGFSIKPNFGRYALFSSWRSASDAEAFLQQSGLFRQLKDKSQESFTLKMLPFMSKGSWRGQDPFVPSASVADSYEGPIVALTRATIRWQRLWAFWRNVPGVSRETMQAPGLLAQIGVGELPVIQQGTISIWQNQKSLRNFAYQMQQHRQVIAKTRAQNWYKEELFARFVPLEASGSWDGQNPLKDFCKPLEQALL